MAALTLQEKIDAARAAYAELIGGKAARVYVDQNGERIEYSTGSAPRLFVYIEQLLSEQRTLASPPTGPRQPMRFVF